MTSKAIVLGITANLGFAAGTLLASIRANDPACDATVILLHDGLDAEQQAAFRRLWPDCRLQDFCPADAVACLRGAAAAFLKKYSPLVLAKLQLPELLADFERVVWLDADILVRGSLAALWDFDCLAWRGLPAGAHKRREKALSLFPELRLDPSVPHLNGGVIGVSRRFAELGGTAALLQGFAKRLAADAPNSQIDELPWYLAAASRSMPVTEYPMALNHPVGLKGVEEAVVQHAIGEHKFWNATPLMQQFPDWARYQRVWVEHGGQPYSGPVHLSEVHPLEPTEVLRAAQARAHWLAVFRELRPVLPKGMVVDLQHDRKQLRIFLHGRPEAECLLLHRHSNDRRIGIEVVLPAALRERALQAIGQVKWAKQDKGAVASVPLTHLGEALAAVEAALAQPEEPAPMP